MRGQTSSAAAADVFVRASDGVADVVALPGESCGYSHNSLLDCETTAALLPNEHDLRTVRRIAEELGALTSVDKTPGSTPERSAPSFAEDAHDRTRTSRLATLGYKCSRAFPFTVTP